MKILCRDLNADKDGIPGYIAHPERKEPGPGILIIHHHYGVTGHLKSVTCWRYLTRRNDVAPKRCAVVGYCMGGRIGIHFVAATPGVRSFVGYYPSVRDEGPSQLRPRHPNDAVRDFKCPSLIFFGGNDHVASVAVQDRLKTSFHANGQSLDWHFFQHAGHGFALGDGDCYDPRLAGVAWTITSEFLERELGTE
jgi:carboxymethylenebutenolidase